MKKHYIPLMLSFLFALTSFAQTPIITNVVDGSCGNTSKFVELYVSGTVDFADYKLVRRSNAGTWAADGFDIDISALGNRTDEFVYLIRDLATLNTEFPSATITAGNSIVDGGISHNGDDSYRIVQIAGDVVIDQFGGDDDGTGMSWEYTDSWGSRNSGVAPNPTFTISEWTFNGVNTLDPVGVCNGAAPLEDTVTSIGAYMPPVTVTGPTTSAPTPAEDPADVVSIFSDTYTDLAIANYDPNWGQSGHTLVNTTFDPTGAGTDFVLAYPNFNYQGTDFGSNEDLSGMDFLHIDIWVEAGTDRLVKVSPISNGAGPVEVLVEVPLTPGSWNSVTLDKADFAGMGWESIYQLKFDGQFNGDGSANTTPFDIYLDNIYFSKAPPSTNPTASAPLPTEDPADVISMYSGAFTNVPVDTWLTPWSPPATVLEDIQIQGNDTKKYSNVDFLGIETVVNPIDASGMDYFHMDVWTPDATTFRIKLVNFGASTTEGEIQFPIAQQQWVSLKIPLASFGDPTLVTGPTLDSTSSIAQLILSGLPAGAFTAYIDNIYFSKEPPPPVTAPTVSAPVPTEDSANVVSIYSDTYTDLAIANYDPNWGQSGHTLVNTTFDPTGAGTDFALAYPNFNYQGTDFGSNEDLSDMDFLHVDIWVAAGTDRMVKVSPISNGAGPVEVLVEVPLTPGSWNSVTLDKADFAGMGWESIYQLKFDGQFNGDGSANTTPFDIYLDNIYFSKTPASNSTTLAGPFSVVNPNTVTVNVNDAVNSAGFSPLLYDSFEVTVDWVDTNNAYSSEADMDIITSAGTVSIDPPTTGGATNGNPTTLTFVGDFNGIYDPSSDGTLDLVLNQSWNASSANWSNIVVTLFEVPACPTPGDLTVANVTDSSVDLSWDASANETSGYEWVVMNSGDAPDTATAAATGTVGTGVLTANVTGLMSASTYDAYFRTNCGTDGFSDWNENVSSFTTACLTFVAPYNEDFNADPLSIPNCWSQGAANAENWLFRDTPIGHIGNNGSFSNTSFSAGGFAWVDDSSGHNIDTRLESPFIDVSGLTVPALSFYYISDNEGDANGNVDFRVEVWDGAAWNQVFFSNQNSPNAEWAEVIVDLSTLTITDNIQLAFIVDENNGTGFDDDLAIDDVKVDEFPSCFPPSNLVASNISTTSLDLSWDADGTEVNGYEWVVMNTGDTPDVATAVATGTVGSGILTANITGLPASSSYSAYVRTDCDTSGISDWSIPTNFDTLCDVFVAPFNEDFSTLALPNCWEQGAANAESWNFTDTPTGHIGNVGSFTNSSASAGGFAWVDDSSPHSTDTRLESPFIDVSGLAVPALSFYYISDNEGDANGNVDFRVEVWDGAAWNQVFFSNQNSPNAEWAEVIVDLSTLTITGDIQLAFIVDENNGTGFDDDLAIDDVTVDEAPPCLKPVNLTASNILLTTADASWDPVTNATNGYLWSLFAAGDDPLVDTPLDSGTTDAATTSVSLSGLTEATDYEFYVESDCDTDGTSGLSAPLGFSTLTPGLDCATPLSATVTPFGDTSQPINFDTTVVPDMSSVPSCEGVDSTEQGYWYEFTTNSTDGVTLSLLSGDPSDIEGAVYDSCGGAELFCFADGNSQDFTSDVLVTGLVANTSYILQVYTESFADGAFSLAITDLPACPQPVNLNATGVGFDTATLNWDNVTNAVSGYTYEVYTSPSDPLNDTPVDSGAVAAGTNSVVVSGLLAETDYDFYVIADCDTDGTSSQAGPVTFTTGCAPFALNVEEDFTGLNFNVNTSLNCWAEGSGLFTPVGSSGWTGQTFNNDASNDNGNGTSLYVNLYNSGGQTNEFVTSPSIDLGAGDPNYILRYDAFVKPWTGTAQVTDMGLHSVSVVISTDGGATWDLANNTLTTYDTSNIPNDLSNTLETISLASYSGVIKIGFLTDEEGTATDLRFYIDNFYVGPTPPPANDNLCDAFPLTVGAPTTPDAYTNVLATAEANEPIPACFADGINGSVWFTFVAPASGDVTVTTDIAGSTSDDTEIAVYDAPTDCTDLTTLGPDLGCDQDGGAIVNFNSILSLAGLTPGNTYYIQVDIWSFVGNTDLAFGEFGIRVLDNNPPCPDPTNLSVTNIGEDSATLNWDDVVEATTGYEWSVFLSPSDPTVDTPVASGTTGAGIATADVLGLLPQTDYDFYVLSDCDVDGQSILSEAVTFTTLCTAFVAPYIDGFETFDVTTDLVNQECWSEISPTAYDWEIDSNGTDSTGTGPNGPFLGSRYAVVDATDGANGDVATFQSPAVDVSGLTTPSLSFYYHMYGAFITQLDVEVSGDGGPYTNELSIVGQQQTGNSEAWELAVVDLSAYAGQTISVRFITSKSTQPGNTFEGDVAIDEVRIDELPTCSTPTGLAVSNVTLDSADLSWDDDATATNGYNWSIYTSPSDPSADTPVATGSTAAGMTMATATGLSTFTTYDLYVEADCGTDGTSVPAGPISFTTLPDFCAGDLFYDNGGPGANYTNNSNETTTISPANPGDVVYVEFLSFDTELNWDGIQIYDGPDTSSPLIDSGFVNPGFGPLSNGTWTGTGVNSPQGVTFISTHPTGALTFVFTSDDSINAPGWEATVTCALPPTCPDPTGLAVSNVSTDSADLSWNDNVTATNGYVWSVFTSPSDPLVDSPVATGSTGAGVATATAIGLSSATAYDFYLTADCDTGGTSNLVGPVTFSTTPDYCAGDLFYDNGGPGANYTNNSNETTTISPANPGDVVTVEFLSFDTELNWDGIQIYDGPDASAPLIDSGYVAPGFSPLPNGTWTGEPSDASSAEGVTFVSSHPTGALTFVFTSDDIINAPGWEAVVTCAAPEILDYYNLQFPATGNITTGDSFSVFAQAYEAGLTDASDTPAAGIEAWIGYSTTDSSPDTASDWTWVLASTNPGFDFTQNNDEYTLDLGAELSSAGTYYYASRWSLNGGPFTYGGILPDGSNGGEWGTGGFISGVLTVNPACSADAGTLIIDADPVSLIGGTATVSATEDVAPTVPAGYQVLYVLTSGTGLVIEQTNATPTFDVSVAGDYTIHTLVYDPITLDLSIITPGVTTGFDVNALLIQGGGTICASLDVAGAPVTVELPAPMTPAPDPIEPAADVISMYSGVYTNVPVDTWLTGWSSAQLADIQIQGNDTKLYTNLDFAGIETVTNPIDASGMDFFHIDVWSPNATTFRVKLVDLGAGAVEGEIAFSIAQEQWVSLQIPLTDFADPTIVTDPNNLLTVTNSIQQVIISGLPVGAVTAYVDNVYFSKTTVGTNQFDRNNFSFYPNPANNELNLVTSSQVEQVRVYNMLGQQVIVETPNTVSPRLNVESLQSGTYIMNVTIDGASKNFKFVKE